MRSGAEAPPRLASTPGSDKGINDPVTLMTTVGIVHVHSTLSYDGKETLDDLAAYARKRGYGFVGISEHSNTFDAAKMACLVDECRRLSSLSFLMIPGLEFTCDNNLHLLALGIERFTEATNPIAVARFIRAQGGVAVMSHPSRYDYKLPAGLAATLDGIEVWNAAYDGRFSPNNHSIALLKDLRRCHTDLRGFGGQDLHRITAHNHVTTIVRCRQLTRGAILEGLKSGNFVIANPFLRLRSSEIPGPLKLYFIRWLRRAYLTAKTVRTRVVSDVG